MSFRKHIKNIGLNIKKHIYLYIVSFVFLVFGLLLLNVVSAQDLMEQAFSSARSYDTIVDMGNTKDAVGNEFLRESASVSVNENLGQGCFINNQFVNIDEDGCAEQGGDWDIQMINTDTNPPLIVRITTFLLRMTIVLSITMVIYNAVAYMVEAINGKDRKTAEAKKNLIGVVSGVMLALMSVGIINLVVSIPKSSLDTSDEISAFDIGCKIGSEIIKGNELKEQVCFNSTFGYDQATMQYRERKYLKPLSMGEDLMEDRVLGGYRCKIAKGDAAGAWNDFKWEKITDAEAELKCEEDLGGELIKSS